MNFLVVHAVVGIGSQFSAGARVGKIGNVDLSDILSIQEQTINLETFI